MGQEIVYCFRCQRRVLGQEFATGAAYQIGLHVTCGACAVHLLETLGPKEKEQLLAKMFKTTQERQKAAAPAKTSPLSSSSTRLRAQAPRAPAAPARRSPALPIAAAAAGVAVLLVALVVAFSGGTPPPAPSPDSTAAVETVEKARRFARENPRDFPGQDAAWRRALDAAKGTPLLEEARRELAGVPRRREEALARELAELDARTAGLVKTEEFKAAELLLREARARYEGADWTSRVDAKIRQAHEEAARLYRALKAAAVEARARRAEPEVRAFQERVRGWGLPELIADLATLPPPPPEERPWTSLLAGGLKALSLEGEGGWIWQGGVLVKNTKHDQAAQTRHELEDGEVRLRFEIGPASLLFLALRQGGDVHPEVALGAPELEAIGRGPHELIAFCKGDTVTATLNGKPVPVRPGRNRRGRIQFNASPGAELRVLSLDVRPAR